MLDKSLPYYDIIMKRDAGSSVFEYRLPDGYSFSMFKNGDEKAWSKIEASVLEFDDELDALLYFQKDFMPFISELERRCLFIENSAGEKIATSTAWWDYTGSRRYPMPHWVAVKPQYQGLGLGKAVVSRITQLMVEIDGDMDFYLHTQTWSHKAVKIYERLGYSITSEKNLFNYTNENYEKAMDILRGISNG